MAPGEPAGEGRANWCPYEEVKVCQLHAGHRGPHNVGRVPEPAPTSGDAREREALETLDALEHDVTLLERGKYLPAGDRLTGAMLGRIASIRAALAQRPRAGAPGGHTLEFLQDGIECYVCGAGVLPDAAKHVQLTAGTTHHRFWRARVAHAACVSPAPAPVAPPPVVQPWGRCASCGADVNETDMVVGHTRSEHAPDCHGECVGKRSNCPAAVSCGPVHRAPVSPPPHCFCGTPMARNPHPAAGKPETLLEVGAVDVCIPCLTKSRHRWATRAYKAEARIEELEDLLASPPVAPLDREVLADALSKAWHRLKNSQVDLDPDAARILHDNAWALYGGQPVSPPPPAVEAPGGPREVIEAIALVTAYTEPLPGSLAGHVKVLMDELLAVTDEITALRAQLASRTDGARGGAGPTDEELAGAHVMHCDCDIQGVGGAPRTTTDRACIELRARLAPGATGATGGGA